MCRWSIGVSNIAAFARQTGFSNMRKFSLALFTILGLPSMVATATGQTSPPELPIAIMCYAKQDQSWRVGYLHRVQANGDALYMTADGKLSATLSAKGVIAPPSNRPAGVDCYGKTLDELRSNGRVMEFQRVR
jgi:hypothetical protein